MSNILILIIDSVLFFSVKPLSLEMLGVSGYLSAGVTTELVCRVVGSLPNSMITWWIDEKLKPDVQLKVS